MDPFDLLVQIVLIGVPLIYLALQIRAVIRWTGGVRLAALIPPALWGGWAAVLVLDLSRDPATPQSFSIRDPVRSAPVTPLSFILSVSGWFVG